MGKAVTMEALAAAAILRERTPDLKLRFVNVVDLFKLQPASEHPHGSTEREFDSLFTTDKPIILTSTAIPGSSTSLRTVSRDTITCTCAATKRRATSIHRWSWRC
jgi:phosphoketolase